MSEQRAQKSRLRQTAGDMIRSLAVVLLVVGFILLVTKRPAPDPVRAIDPAPVLALARAEAAYPIAFPDPVPSGWRATSARWEPTAASAPAEAWQIGFVTDQDRYLQIGQSATQSPDYVPEQVGSARPAGSISLGGVDWQRYESAAGDQRALVRIVDGVTTVVSGTADWPAIEGIAVSLPRG